MRVSRMIVTDIAVNQFGGFKTNLKVHHLSYIYVGVMGCQMCVSRNKRGLRRKGLNT